MILKTSVHLPNTLVEQLLQLLQQSPHKAICGLVGRRGSRSFCYPIDLASTDASALFAVNASEHLSAIKTMTEKGQTLFAIYHSHPTSAMLPSVKDLEDADYPEALYLIISLNARGVLELRGFYLRDQKIDEVELSI